MNSKILMLFYVSTLISSSLIKHAAKPVSKCNFQLAICDINYQRELYDFDSLIDSTIEGGCTFDPGGSLSQASSLVSYISSRCLAKIYL